MFEVEGLVDRVRKDLPWEMVGRNDIDSMNFKSNRYRFDHRSSLGPRCDRPRLPAGSDCRCCCRWPLLQSILDANCRFITRVLALVARHGRFDGKFSFNVGELAASVRRERPASRPGGRQLLLGAGEVHRSRCSAQIMSDFIIHGGGGGRGWGGAGNTFIPALTQRNGKFSTRSFLKSKL